MASVRPFKILIADDSPIVLRVIRRKLERLGFEVIEASTEAQCGAVEGASLNFAVFDLELGDACGTVSAGRLLAGNRALRVAFFSSSNKPPALARAAALGRVFSKDDGIDALLAWVGAQQVA